MTTTTIQIPSLTPHPTLEYWSVCKVEALFETPFLGLVYRAAQVHRENFNPRARCIGKLSAREPFNFPL